MRDLIQVFTSITAFSIDEELLSLESLLCPDRFDWLVAPIVFVVAQVKEPVVQNGEPAGYVRRCCY